MRNVVGLILAGAGLVVVLAGCEEAKQKLGINVKSAPDEFAVYSRAPLSLPPDYSLRPPAPGNARPQEVEPRRQAERAVAAATSRTARAQAETQAQARLAGASPGLQAFLKQTGTLDAEPGIRDLVDRETTQATERDRSLADRVIFWQPPLDSSRVVDPSREAQRIRESQALGRPITEGETPIIERRKKGLFEGILN